MIVDEEESGVKIDNPPPKPPHTHHISNLLHLHHNNESTAKPAAIVAHGDLTEAEINNLIDLAMKARDTAYAPYSNFRVGAALLDVNGRVFTGCNVENASYGLSICAERVTYTKAVSEGSKKYKAIVVSTDVLDRFLSPCGACRQFAAEWGEHKIIMVKPDRVYKVCTVSELLPGGFVPNDLEAPRQ